MIWISYLLNSWYEVFIYPSHLLTLFAFYVMHILFFSMLNIVFVLSFYIYLIDLLIYGIRVALRVYGLRVTVLRPAYELRLTDLRAAFSAFG